MKIDYAIVSSDSNRMYLDFWPIVRDLWINKIQIKPILVYIGDSDQIIDNGDHIIHKVKAIKGIDTGFQSQICRMYIAKYYYDDIILTSDIDMLPLNSQYFNETIRKYDDDDIVILSSDAYPNISRYPICYNIGKGSSFNDVLQFDNSFEAYTTRLLIRNQGWGTDELFFGEKIDKFKDQNRIIKLNRGWIQGRALNRIDRVAWSYSKEDVYKEKYIDCHSLRPYSKYKTLIDKMLDDLNGT